MFPYVCVAMMPLFCHNDWPRKLTSKQPLKSLFSWGSKRIENTTKVRPGLEFYEKEIEEAGCLLFPYQRSKIYEIASENTNSHQTPDSKKSEYEN